MPNLKKISGTHFLDFSSAAGYGPASGCGFFPPHCLQYNWINPISFGQILRLSLSRLISSTNGRLISIERLGCDQMFSIETAFSGSSLSRAATQGDVKGVN